MRVTNGRPNSRLRRRGSSNRSEQSERYRDGQCQGGASKSLNPAIVVSPEFFSSVIELQPCARSDVISGFHYKHVDYYDEALFNRAYEWMKERGHDRRPEPARRARCRLSVAYAGVAFRLSSAANLRGSWLKTRPRAMFRPRNHSAFSCTKVFSR